MCVYITPVETTRFYAILCVHNRPPEGGDPLTEERKRFLADYRKSKLHRIPLDVPHEMYYYIKQAADQKQMPVNTFIKWLLSKYIDSNHQA